MSSNYNTCINAGSLVFTTNSSSNNSFITANCFTNTNTGSITLGTDYYLNVNGMSSTSYFYNSGKITLYARSSPYNNNPSTLVIDSINFYNTGSIQGQGGPNSIITNNSGQITTGQINVIYGQYIPNAPPN